MNHLVIYNPTNRLGKRDGDEFHSEALAYAEYHRGLGDKVYTMRHDEMKLDHAMNVDVVSIFCHGASTWLGLGEIAKTPEGLSAWICQFAAPMVSVCLYACKTGRETSAGRCYARELFRSIMDTGRGCIVWAHTTAGHTTRNPNLVLFPGVDGGRQEVPRVVRHRLRKLLWGPTTARFDVPLCETMGELLSDIVGVPSKMVPA